jgi:hypothetical protein
MLGGVIMIDYTRAIGYIQHGDQEIQQIANSYVLLWEAVRDMYYSANWIPDRECNPKLMSNLVALCEFPKSFDDYITQETIQSVK